MRHLKIEMIGYLNIARPQWPINWSHYDDNEVKHYYDSEPIVSVEITKRDWDDMFDIYEAHMKVINHPAVRDAWEKYELTRALVGKQK